MVSGLNYLTIPDALQQGLRERMAERPEFAAVSTAMQPAPMQGGLAAAAPRSLTAILAAGQTPVPVNPGLYNETAEEREARLASPPEWLQNFYDLQSKPAAEQFRATPEMSQEEIMRRGNASALDALSRQLFGRAIDIFENPYVDLRGSRPKDEFTSLQLRDDDAYRLLVDGQEVGKATGRQDVAALIDTIKGYQDTGGKKADIQLQRYNKPFASIHEGVPGYEGGYGTVFHDMPDPDGLGDFLLKTVLPIGASFIPGIGPALGAKLGLGGKLGAAVGTGLAGTLGRTAGGVLSGDPLGESLKAGLISGATAALTQGALGAIPGADKFLSGAASGAAPGVSNVGGALKDGFINVIASKLPSAAISGIASAAGSGLSNLLPSEGGVGAPGQYIPPLDDAFINVITNKLPGAAIPGIASAAGSGLSNLLPSEGGVGAPEAFESPTTEEREIGVLADRIPPTVIATPPLSFPGIDTGGLTQAIPDLSVQPEVAQPVEEDEINVVANTQTPSNFDPGSLVAGLPLLAPLFPANVPQIAPSKTPLQKALTTGGRVLTGLSILGGLAGGGGRNTSALGTGAAAIGTRASLDPVFGGQLPTASGIFAPQSMAPRVMSDIDFERYGYGPARSFFENVPETPEQYRAALAANAPRPMETGAGTVGVPNFLSNFISPAAGSAALQAVRRLAPGVPDAQIEAFLATPEGADFLAAIQESQSQAGSDFSVAPDSNNSFARGGAMANKGRGKPSRDSYAVNGAGTGRSDEIPALLSDGEYVIDAETVAMLGDGSSKAGAKRFDDLRVKIRKHKGRNLAKGRFSDNAKAPEKYLSGGRT